MPNVVEQAGAGAPPSGSTSGEQLPNDHGNTAHASTPALTLLALGVVFGDIGTSPLYAVKETFSEAHGIPANIANILGGLSTILWSLMIVVTLKYVLLMMRASNKGEGGIMALLALATSAVKGASGAGRFIFVLGIAGAALFFGDAVLTPAMSVLSAVEGLEVGTSVLHPVIVPIAVVVLITLFMLQRHGTAIVGAFFGPVCVVWFLTLGVIGVVQIGRYPAVLAAFNPAHAVYFLTHHGFAAFVVLGAVFLSVTGAEALYADMGHFGKRPIRIAWFGLVLPALVLNYFGQGALLIVEPSAIRNPFYLAFPEWALYPMIGLATAATVIASQATISGAYSITRQAIQLGYLPRLNILHTSESEIGQVYLPALNWTLLAAVLIAVIGFGSSSALASAYGVSVAGTMLIDTVLAFFVVYYAWHYNPVLAIGATLALAVVDLSFFSANLLKVASGGWFPLVIASVMMVIMATWYRGRRQLRRQLEESSIALDVFLQSLFRHPPPRVKGTAVFLTTTPNAVPHALLHNLNHNKVLHERVIFLTVVIRDVPHVPQTERVGIEDLIHNCFRLTVYFGFKDRPDVMQALDCCRPLDLEFQPLETSFFLSREALIPSVRVAGMALWRDRLFAAMAKNASSAVEYFNLPTNRVIEIGTQIEI